MTGGLSSNGDASQGESAVVVTKLDFTYDGMDKPVLKKFDLDLPAGSRYEYREVHQAVQCNDAHYT